jgi:excisionase family DNA binding protein
VNRVRDPDAWALEPWRIVATVTGRGPRVPSTVAYHPEVAELIGTPQRTVYRQLAEGRLPAIRIGWFVLVRRKDLEEWPQREAGRWDGGEAYDASRATREATTSSREATNVARARTTDLRVNSATGRDATATGPGRIALTPPANAPARRASRITRCGIGRARWLTRRRTSTTRADGVLVVATKAREHATLGRTLPALVEVET